MKKIIISFIILIPMMVYSQEDFSTQIKGRYVFPFLNGFPSCGTVVDKQFVIANVVNKETLFDRTIYLSDNLYIIIGSNNYEYDVKTYGDDALFLSFKYNSREARSNSDGRNQGSSDIQVVYSPCDDTERLYAFVYMRGDKRINIVDLKEAKVVCSLASNIEVPNIDVFAPIYVNKKNSSIYNDLILLTNNEKVILFDKLPSDGETSISNIKENNNIKNSAITYDVSGRKYVNQSQGGIQISNGKKYIKK